MSAGMFDLTGRVVLATGGILFVDSGRSVKPK